MSHLTEHWESSWLNIESQVDSTLRVKLTQHWESNWLKYSSVTHFAQSNYNSAPDSTFKVKMTQLFLSVHWARNWVILTYKVESNFSTASGSTFRVKMTQFVLSVHWAKKLSHFELKTLVEFWYRQWLKF